MKNSIQGVNVSGDCSFCWYWWNCWPSVFKLSFRKVTLYNYITLKVGILAK